MLRPSFGTSKQSDTPWYIFIVDFQLNYLTAPMAFPTALPMRGVNVIQRRCSTPDLRPSNIENGTNTNIRARGPRDLQSLAGQIMFLPPDEPTENVLKVMGSNQYPMHGPGYDHPVLVLTDPDRDGYVVFQKLTSLGGNTLAEHFPSNRDSDLRASYMQINTREKPDEDAGAILYLSPEDNYLRKRSYVETNMSYKCKKDLLLPYFYHNSYLSNQKYFLRNDSYWKVFDRVLLLRVSGVNNFRGERTNGGLSNKPSINFRQRRNNSCRASMDSHFRPLSHANAATPSASRPQSIIGRNSYADAVQSNTGPGTPSPPRPPIRPSASKASLRSHPTLPASPPVPQSVAKSSLRPKTPTTPKKLVQGMVKGVKSAMRRRSLTPSETGKLAKAAQSVERGELKDLVQEQDVDNEQGNEARDMSLTELKEDHSARTSSWTNVLRGKRSTRPE